MEILTKTVVDKVPDGFTDDPAVMAQLLGTTGYEDLNTERQEIEKDAGIQNPIDTGSPEAKPAEQPNYLNNNAQQQNVVQSETSTSPFEDILNPTVPPASVGNTEEAPPIQGQQTFTQADVDARVEAEIKTIEEKYKEIAQDIQRFKENPYDFLAEKAPHLVQKFDKIGYIKSELAKEFGAEFQVIASEIGIPGTESNAYLLKQMELQKQVESLSSKAQMQLQQAELARESEIKNYKQEIMKRYNFQSEGDFDKQVWQELLGLDPKEVWSRLAEHKLLKERIQKVKQGITTPAKTGFETPGVTQTQEINRNPGDDAWKSLFPEYAHKSAENRIF